MGGSGSKETPATCAAAAALGEKRVALCHALFEKLAGKRYAVSAREFLADTLGVGRGLPDTHLGWLADFLAKRAGPDPHPPRQSHTGHHHRKHTDAQDCESNSAEEDGHCAMTKRTYAAPMHALLVHSRMEHAPPYPIILHAFYFLAILSKTIQSHTHTHTHGTTCTKPV